jgi:hypothetical protein
MNKKKIKQNLIQWKFCERKLKKNFFLNQKKKIGKYSKKKKKGKVCDCVRVKVVCLEKNKKKKI